VGDENAPYVGVREMAADYIGHMRRVQPTGPYAVGGYSFGGLVAWEIAQQLSRAGETVELVTLIDTHVHGRYLPLWEWVRYCSGWLGVTWRRLRSLPLRGQVDYLRKKAMVLRDRWRVAMGLNPRHPELVGDVLREANLPPALRRTRGAMLVALREYRPEPYAGRVVFLRASRPGPGDPLPVWRKVAQGGLEVDVTPGDHDEMIAGANAKALASALARHL
jgi:acetoacetyl-CoA synthetase